MLNRLSIFLQMSLPAHICQYLTTHQDQLRQYSPHPDQNKILTPADIHQTFGQSTRWCIDYNGVAKDGIIIRFGLESKKSFFLECLLNYEKPIGQSFVICAELVRKYDLANQPNFQRFCQNIRRLVYNEAYELYQSYLTNLSILIIPKLTEQQIKNLPQVLRQPVSHIYLTINEEQFQAYESIIDQLPCQTVDLDGGSLETRRRLLSKFYSAFSQIPYQMTKAAK